MRKQQLYTLHIDTIKKLNLNIMRGNRSQFVESAILAKLNNLDQVNIDEYETRKLIAIVYNRLCNQLDDTPLCGIMRSVLLEWINQ